MRLTPCRPEAAAAAATTSAMCVKCVWPSVPICEHFVHEGCDIVGVFINVRGDRSIVLRAGFGVKLVGWFANELCV